MYHISDDYQGLTTYVRLGWYN